MLACLIAQALSPGERFDALGEHFGSRTDFDGLQVLYVTLTLAVLLCGVLVLMGRIQRAGQQREERAREQRRRALTSSHQPGVGATRNLSLIQERQAQRRAAAGPTGAGLGK